MEATLRQNEVARVVVVDDHILFKEMITSVVNSLPGLAVVGWAKSESEAMTLCWREKPDIVVLDLLLSSSSGMVALGRLHALCPNARILVFSGNLTPGLIKRVLATGPFSLIAKSATLDEFRRALQSVAAGLTYFSPDIAATIRSLVVEGRQSTPGEPPRLSSREEAVLGYLARGMNSREIAAALGLSQHTVANHRSRLMRKIGLHRVAQLSIYAASQGLLEGPVHHAAKSRPAARRAS